jgi:hypothetical protein
MNVRLEELLAELGKHFGKLTRWRALCQERDTTTDEGKIRLAEEVLSAYSTGTVAEWHSFHLRLQGKKIINVDDFLAGRAAVNQSAETSELKDNIPREFDSI